MKPFHSKWSILLDKTVGHVSSAACTVVDCCVPLNQQTKPKDVPMRSHEIVWLWRWVLPTHLPSPINILFITGRVVRIVLPIITLTSREGRDPPENGVLTILTVWSKQERLKKTY